MDNTPVQNNITPPQPQLGQAPQPQTSIPSNNKPKTGLIIGIIAAVIGALLIIGAILWLVLFYLPEQRVRSAADNFVTLVKDGKHQDALKLTAADDDDEAATLQLIKSLDSSLGDGSYKISTVTNDDSTKLVKYVVDNDDDKRFTVGITDQGGTLKVNNIVIDLGDSQKSDSNNKAVSDSPSTACLPQASLKGNFRYTTGWDFYFEPDTNKVLHETVAAGSADQMKQFYDDNKQYNFTYDIDVSLYQGSADNKAAQDLALLRASVVAYNMNLRGIPYANMRFGKVNYEAGNASTPENATSSRAAWVNINSDCDAQSTPQNLDQKIDAKYGL